MSDGEPAAITPEVAATRADRRSDGVRLRRLTRSRESDHAVPEVGAPLLPAMTNGHVSGRRPPVSLGVTLRIAAADSLFRRGGFRMLCFCGRRLSR